jgi:hypothetical protein
LAEISLFRLYLLRAMYLLMAVGIGLNFWPHVIHHTNEYAAKNGAEICLLAGIGAMAAVGLRYPLQMLPILFFEFFWKATWMIAMALPLWAAHQTYPGMSEDLFAIGAGVVLCPIVIPWGYVFATYIKRPGDRWR